MSRMIFGVALGFAMLVAVGCGSKSDPTQPGVVIGPDSVPSDPTPPTPPTPPKVEPVKVVWEMDPAKHAIPDSPVTGTLAGAAFTPGAVLEGPELKFRVLKAGSSDPERQVAITLPQPIDGRTFKVQPDQPNSPELPKIFALFPPAAPGQPGGALFPGSHASYAMTLELGKPQNGKVTGRIHLSLYDESKSVLAGTFTADYLRPHTERPGPDDAPYVTGEVTVVGAKPDAEVRVAYAAFAPAGVSFKELQIAFDPKPVEQAAWTREDSDKPRTSTLIPGDGKSRPFRYEHVKLQPGRYLLSAAVAGGPAVWKWIDVPANGTLTENFTLDVSKTGGLEVSVPLGVTGRVFLAPADEPTRPAIDVKLFEGISVQVVRTDVDVVGGKAIVKNLGAGKYEVRTGDLRGTVEVVPGKTAELNLSPPKK